jgi:hypothetical protein
MRLGAVRPAGLAKASGINSTLQRFGSDLCAAMTAVRSARPGRSGSKVLP